MSMPEPRARGARARSRPRHLRRDRLEPAVSRMNAVGVLGSALALALALRPESVHAQAKTALSWVRTQGAESCIAATELGRRVEQLVGPVLASAPEGQISIEGGIKKSGTGFEADVAVSDAS